MVTTSLTKFNLIGFAAGNTHGSRNRLRITLAGNGRGREQVELAHHAPAIRPAAEQFRCAPVCVRFGDWLDDVPLLSGERIVASGSSWGVADR
jgi:hypothetical protein